MGRAGELWRWLRRFWGEVGAFAIPDRAAALTYYSVLSLGPALVVIVALLGLVGGTATMLDQLANFAPGSARDTIEAIISDVGASSTGSGVVLFVVGLLAAVWSASGYVGAFGRAADAIEPGEVGGSGVRQVITRVVVTVAIFLLIFVIAAMLLVSGPLAETVARFVGLGSEAPRIWSLAKWPALVAAMVVAVSLLFSAAGRRRVRFVSLGGLVAIALWLALSFGFSFYVSRFANYSRVYGSLAGLVVFLIWLWLSNIALLIGVLVDSRRTRRMATVVR